MADTLSPPRRPPVSYAALLGLRARSALAIARAVHEGLAYASVGRLQRATGLPATALAEAARIPLRTLHRRSAQGRLDADESDRLARVARIFAAAIELFEGDADAARAWLTTPAGALGCHAPLALIGTDVGAREVEALILRLEHGVVA
jgi:putative toxin-antitoxin system antitoxin component (TIGR02293 family)